MILLYVIVGVTAIIGLFVLMYQYLLESKSMDNQMEGK